MRYVELAQRVVAEAYKSRHRTKDLTESCRFPGHSVTQLSPDGLKRVCLEPVLRPWSRLALGLCVGPLGLNERIQLFQARERA